MAVFLLDWCSGEAEVGYLLLNKCGEISSNFFNLIPKNCVSGFSIEPNKKYGEWHLGKDLLHNIIYFFEMLSLFTLLCSSFYLLFTVLIL